MFHMAKKGEMKKKMRMIDEEEEEELIEIKASIKECNDIIKEAKEILNGSLKKDK